MDYGSETGHFPRKRISPPLLCRTPHRLAQIAAGVRSLHGGDGLGRSGCDHAPAGGAAFGAEIDDPIRGVYPGPGVLDEDRASALSLPPPPPPSPAGRRPRGGEGEAPQRPRPVSAPELWIFCPRRIGFPVSR